MVATNDLQLSSVSDVVRLFGAVVDAYFNKAPFKFEGTLNKLHFKNLPAN